MNPEQVDSQVRLWLAVAGSVAGALGWSWFGDLSTKIAAFAGPAAVLGSAIWSLVRNRQSSILTAAATLKDNRGQPVVKTIELNPTAAGTVLASPSATPPNVVVAK